MNRRILLNSLAAPAGLADSRRAVAREQGGVALPTPEKVVELLAGIG